jgi:2'-5' RNA ligase
VVLPVEGLSREVAEVRRSYDRVAYLSGLPLHVTALFPFAPMAELTAEVRQRLAAAARSARPAEISLARVAAYGTAIVLEAAASPDLVDCLSALRLPFPRWPVYEGQFPDSTPHVTVGFGAGPEHVAATMVRVRRILEPVLPLPARVRHAKLAVEVDRHTWQTVETFPLGPGHP